MRKMDSGVLRNKSPRIYSNNKCVEFRHLPTEGTGTPSPIYCK